MKPRILCIDPGTKRTGFALSDELGITAQGLATFEDGAGEKLIEHIARLVEEYGVSTIVIGKPMSMSGGDIEGTERSRLLADKLRARCGVEAVLRDERMSSLEVERVMKQEGRIKRAGDIDKLAAVLMLQSYLEEIGG
ncbi:MAG: Holliday junction resolvase RuvX [Bacteroidales bacterium]|nr:Holliday junction resolvase RuvX [Candidatus Latescibacterota bacterium]